MDVIIDTNALVYAAKLKVDVYELLKMHNYKPVIPSCVFLELKSLAGSAKKGADRAAAKLASQIVEKKVRVVDIGTGKADDLILKYAKKHKMKVLTNDRAFKTRLKAEGIDAVSIGKSKQMW